MNETELAMKKLYVPMEDRPRCQNAKCNNPAQHMGNYRKDGTPLFRKLCAKHHNKKTAKGYGLKSILEVRAAKAGMSVAEFQNYHHPYRKHRKEYCENRDGRLGFKCRYKIRHTAQLQVDHINGKPDDNRPRNLQTLCANCHCYKTHLHKDYATPGRKALKSKGLFTQLV